MIAANALVLLFVCGQCELGSARMLQIESQKEFRVIGTLGEIELAKHGKAVVISGRGFVEVHSLPSRQWQWRKEGVTKTKTSQFSMEVYCVREPATLVSVGIAEGNELRSISLPTLDPDNPQSRNPDNRVLSLDIKGRQGDVCAFAGTGNLVFRVNEKFRYISQIPINAARVSFSKTGAYFSNNSVFGKGMEIWHVELPAEIDALTLSSRLVEDCIGYDTTSTGRLFCVKSTGPNRDESSETAIESYDSGERTATFRGPNIKIRDVLGTNPKKTPVAVTGCGRFLAIPMDDNIVAIVNVDSGLARMVRVPVKEIASLDLCIRSEPSELRLACCASDGNCAVVDFSGSGIVRTLICYPRSVRSGLRWRRFR